MQLNWLRALLVLFACVAASKAEDWPQFRGPTGQGHSSAIQLPESWSEQENIRWKTAIPGLGWSSPVVSGNQVWITTAIDAAGSLRALCVDRQTGEMLQDVEVFRKEDLGRIAAKNSHASPTPVLDGKHVYVHFGAHGTACLTTDGETIWRRELAYDHRHGPGGSPVIWNDLLVVVCDGPDQQFTIALDKDNGAVRWKVEHHGQQAYSTPLVIGSGDKAQLITSQGEALIAYRPSDGSELWRCRHAGHSVVPRPVVGNGLVYFCSGSWPPALFAVRLGGKGDITDSHVEFSVRRGVPLNPSPLVVDSRLYLVSDQGVLSCFSATDGHELWRERLGGAFTASPTYADGKIYLLDENGTMHVVADADKFRLISSNSIEGRTLASPAFVEHAIYLRSDTHLYRIEAPRNVRAAAVRPQRPVVTGARDDVPVLRR
jgi:outer membrane protein assembly factor BamB